MKIVFISRHCWPHVGGVEKHVERIADSLRRRGNKVTIISEEDIKYPHIKYFGLLYIWFWIFKNRDLIKQSDIVHCHDVFIWYLPFRFLYPKKPVYTTFHGWEGIWPIPKRFVILKKIASKLSWGTIAVGKYIEKYYGIKADYITYGGAKLTNNLESKAKRIVYLGRLEKDTGIMEFLKWFRSLVHGYKDYRIDFVGDGTLRKECEKYGKVHGFVEPEPYLRKAEYCVPGGYLAYLEARALGCKIMTFYNNPLKEDYWNDIKKAYSKIKNTTWEDIADLYFKLWENTIVLVQ